MTRPQSSITQTLQYAEGGQHFPRVATADADIVYGTFHRQTNFPFKDIIDTNQVHSQNTLSHKGSQIHTAAQVTADRLISRQLLQELPSRTAGHAVTETGGGHRGLLFVPV